MAVPSSYRSVEPLQVLLIEDDEGDRDLALEYLKADRNSLYQVTWANSLEVGLQHLEQARFDVVVLDLVLPDSRGVATVGKVCDRAQGIPVIVSSYFDESALATKAIELGAQDYLAKDHMDEGTLGKTIHRSIARAKRQAAKLAVRQVVPSQPNPADRLTQKLKQLQTDIQRLESAATTIQTLSNQVQDLSDLRRRLITTITHECRSPATVILLATSILKTYDKQLEDTNYLSHLQRIEAAVNQLMQLIDNALILQRVQSQTNSDQFKSFDLQVLCQQVISKIQNTLPLASSLTVSYQGDCSNVSLDKDAIEQILVELITNAIHYSPDSTPIEVIVQVEPRQVILQVADQGEGIPTAEQEQVFEAFYRAKNISSFRGSGLGLAIVKALVDLFEGRIILESQVNSGTTFTVQLPTVTAEW